MGRGLWGTGGRFAALLAAASCALLLGGAAAASGPSGAIFFGSANGDVGSAALDGSGANGSLVTGGENIQGIAVDGNFVYYGDVDTNEIGRANLDGSDANNDFLAVTNPDFLLVYGQFLYWSNPSADAIGRVNVDGTGSDPTFITLTGGGSEALATDGQFLYWSEGTTIGRANLADGSDVNERWFIPGSFTGATGIAVEGPYLYWGDVVNGRIGRVGLDGSGENDSFVSGITDPFSVAADGSHVFWSNTSSQIGRANLDGSGVTNDLVSSSNITQLAVLSTPGAPTNASAVEQPGGAQISFTSPSPNGTPITGYTVTASPGGKTASGTSSPITMAGLTNGTAYTFTVTATNAVGTSPASAASNSVTPSLAPHITSFSPTAATSGARVTIIGTGLANATAVDFTGAVGPATILSNTATSIVVRVPLPVGTGPITVHTPGGVATTATDFKPLALILFTLLTADGRAGDVITFQGQNLTGASSVKFGTIPASFTPVSATQLTATVPSGFSSAFISVTTPNGTGTSGFPFEITKVTGFSPAAAASGAIVTITGQGLGSANAVDFANDPGILPSAITTTSVKVVVPAGADVGQLVVHTPNIDPGGINTTTSFKPVPKIASLSAVDGLAGQTITVNGTNLDNVTSVKFGTATASFTPGTATSFTATVPGGTFSSGVVTVTTTGGTATSAQTFQITKVTGISPASAAANATVTITGQGLGSTNAVDFANDPGITPSSTSATSVKVVVPPDADVGQLVVHTPNIDPGGITTATTFKPIPKVTSLSAVDGLAGNTITVNGTNLDNATSVKFGTAAAAFSGDTTQHLTATVPGGMFSSGLVTVITPGGTATSPQAFAITKITSISPTAAAAGATVTITGQGLGSTNEIDFGSSDVTPSAVTATSVKAVVPTDAGPVGPLTVNTDNAGSVFTPTFKPLPSVGGPVAPAQTGTLAHVTGGNFFPNGMVPPTAKLGTTPVTVENPTETSFDILVPDNAVSGTFTVTTPDGSATGTLLVPPTITIGPTPSSGPVGTPVTVRGLTFSGTTSVKFGNGVTAPFTLTGTLGVTQTLSFKVPTTAASGPITVTNAGGATATIVDFDVTPVIQSFTPTSGPDTGTMKITGTGFGGADLVTFGGGVTAVPVALLTTPTSVTVTVPQGANVGTITVHTPTGGTSAASSATFTPTESVSAIAAQGHSGIGGAAGTRVTITGAGFTNVTDVKFGTTSAGLGGWTLVSPTEIVATVPAGASDGVVSVVRSTAPTLLTSVATFEVVSIIGVSESSVHVGDTLKFFGTHLDHTLNVGGMANFGISTSFVSADEVDIVVPDGVFTGVPNLNTSDLGEVVAPEAVGIEPPQVTSIGITNNTDSTFDLTIFGAGLVNVSSVKIGTADVTLGANEINAGQIDVGSISFGLLPVAGDVAVTTDEGTSNAGFDVYRHTSTLPSVYVSGDAPGSYTQSDAIQWLTAIGATTDIVGTFCGADEAAEEGLIGNQFYVAVYGGGPLQGQWGSENLGDACPDVAGTKGTWN